MIHTSRTVTVGKTESIINEPIVLYRGDREVEVEFAIVGSKFTFSKGGNVIKSTNATHGQLVVDTPTGENMFSEVTECHEGKVVFIITKEMIDELAEVGLYSFQIRLFDESQVSRVTIPPVYQGIEIRHPMAAEDETDLVDIGLVDYSVVRKNDYENVATFLPNGDYNKTNWEEHDVISRDRLNKVEDALYEINKGTEGLYPTFQNQYDEFSTKVNKDVKAYKEEMEDEVEQFERDMTQAFGEFKVDYRDDMYDRIDVVEGELEEANSQLAHIATLPSDAGDIDSLEKAILEVKNKGGNRLYLPAKTYVIDRPLIISNLGIDIQAVPYRTKIQPSDIFKGDELIRFEQNEENLYKGVNIEGLYIDCKGKECNGITFINAYDQFSLRNIEVRNCNDNYIAFNFEQHNDRVGQTLLIENCIGDHISNSANKPVWYFNRYQEVNMIGTKAFGSKANMNASGIGYHFVDCKGITMTGCSHSFCENGVVIEAKNRHCNGFNLIAMNHEEVGNNSIKTIVHDSYLISSLNVWGIRDQNGIGNIKLDGVRNSTLFTTYSSVEILNSCSNVMIISGDKSKVINHGVNSTVIGASNSSQQIEIITGLGLTSNNTPRLDFSIEGANKTIRTKYSATEEKDYGYIVENITNGSAYTLMKLLRAYSSLYSNNIETLRATTTGTNSTGLMLLVNINGVDKLVKVLIGEKDSAGTGYRALRIPNDI